MGAKRLASAEASAPTQLHNLKQLLTKTVPEKYDEGKNH